MIQQGRRHAHAFDDKNVVWQRTLKTDVTCADVGLHSGVIVNMTLKPAPVGSGISFVRIDVDGSPMIPARWDYVVDTRMCSVLANADGISVGTVEHLMAAFAGCGIDNAIVELDNSEVPILDGSSQPFVDMIKRAGVVEQEAPRRVIRVLKEVVLETASGKVALSPAEKQTIEFEIEFANKVIERQEMKMAVVNGAFCKELANARTFGFLHEVEALRAAGLAKGGSLKNAIVVDDNGVLNEDGLRHDDEFVRHKVLDAIGDLYLAGAPIIGKFVGVCSGHAANNQLLRALMADPTAWRWDVVRGHDASFAIDGGIVAERQATVA